MAAYPSKNGSNTNTTIQQMLDLAEIDPTLLVEEYWNTSSTKIQSKNTLDTSSTNDEQLSQIPRIPLAISTEVDAPISRSIYNKIIPNTEKTQYSSLNNHKNSKFNNNTTQIINHDNLYNDNNNEKKTVPQQHEDCVEKLDHIGKFLPSENYNVDILNIPSYDVTSQVSISENAELHNLSNQSLQSSKQFLNDQALYDQSNKQLTHASRQYPSQSNNQMQNQTQTQIISPSNNIEPSTGSIITKNTHVYIANRPNNNCLSTATAFGEQTVPNMRSSYNNIAQSTIDNHTSTCFSPKKFHQNFKSHSVNTNNYINNNESVNHQIDNTVTAPLSSNKYNQKHISTSSTPIAKMLPSSSSSIEQSVPHSRGNFDSKTSQVCSIDVTSLKKQHSITTTTASTDHTRQNIHPQVTSYTSSICPAPAQIQTKSRTISSPPPMDLSCVSSCAPHFSLESSTGGHDMLSNSSKRSTRGHISSPTSTKKSRNQTSNMQTGHNPNGRSLLNPRNIPLSLCEKDPSMSSSQSNSNYFYDLNYHNEYYGLCRVYDLHQRDCISKEQQDNNVDEGKRPSTILNILKAHDSPKLQQAVSSSGLHPTIRSQRPNYNYQQQQQQQQPMIHDELYLNNIGYNAYSNNGHDVYDNDVYDNDVYDNDVYDNDVYDNDVYGNGVYHNNDNNNNNNTHIIPSGPKQVTTKIMNMHRVNSSRSNPHRSNHISTSKITKTTDTANKQITKLITSKDKDTCDNEDCAEELYDKYSESSHEAYQHNSRHVNQVATSTHFTSSTTSATSATSIISPTSAVTVMNQKNDIKAEPAISASSTKSNNKYNRFSQKPTHGRVSSLDYATLSLSTNKYPTSGHQDYCDEDSQPLALPTSQENKSETLLKHENDQSQQHMPARFVAPSKLFFTSRPMQNNSQCVENRHDPIHTLTRTHSVNSHVNNVNNRSESRRNSQSMTGNMPQNIINSYDDHSSNNNNNNTKNSNKLLSIKNTTVNLDENPQKNSNFNHHNTQDISNIRFNTNSFSPTYNTIPSKCLHQNPAAGTTAAASTVVPTATAATPVSHESDILFHSSNTGQEIQSPMLPSLPTGKSKKSQQIKKSSQNDSNQQKKNIITKTKPHRDQSTVGKHNQISELQLTKANYNNITRSHTPTADEMSNISVFKQNSINTDHLPPRCISPLSDTNMSYTDQGYQNNGYYVSQQALIANEKAQQEKLKQFNQYQYFDYQNHQQQNQHTNTQKSEYDNSKNTNIGNPFSYLLNNKNNNCDISNNYNKNISNNSKNEHNIFTIEKHIGETAISDNNNNNTTTTTNSNSNTVKNLKNYNQSSSACSSSSSSSTSTYIKNDSVLYPTSYNNHDKPVRPLSSATIPTQPITVISVETPAPLCISPSHDQQMMLTSGGLQDHQQQQQQIYRISAQNITQAERHNNNYTHQNYSNQYTNDNTTTNTYSYSSRYSIYKSTHQMDDDEKFDKMNGNVTHKPLNTHNSIDKQQHLLNQSSSLFNYQKNRQKLSKEKQEQMVLQQQQQYQQYQQQQQLRQTQHQQQQP